MENRGDGCGVGRFSRMVGKPRGTPGDGPFGGTAVAMVCRVQKATEGMG